MESKFFQSMGHATSTIPSMNIKNFIEDQEERVWKGPFTFVCSSDTQFGMIDRIENKPPVPNWDKEIELTKHFIQEVNAMNPKPKFVAMCGDMLDAYPYSTLTSWCNPACGDATLREKQFKDFVKLFMDLDPSIKLVCVCGNHDIGDIPTHETLKLYRSQFGQDYFHFWAGGVKFVVLNSQYMYAPDAIPEEKERQDRFIDTIYDKKAKYMVVFQHIPYFTSNINEDPYGNLSLPKEQRMEYLEKLVDQKVDYIFCGHWHQNGVQNYKGMVQVTTSAVGCAYGKDPSGYRVVEVGEDEISNGRYICLPGGVQMPVEDDEDEENTAKNDIGKECAAGNNVGGKSGGECYIEGCNKEGSCADGNFEN